MFSTRKWRLLALIAAVALVNALVLPALGQVDDPTVEVTATDNTAAEEGLATGAFTLTRTGETTSALDVDYTVTGTATAGDDYVVLSGTATLAIGEATTVVTITPVDDLNVEGDETVILTLVADAAYTIGDDDEATVTIVDNDVLPTVEVAASDATATEAGPTTGAYTLTRTGDLTNTLAVDYTVTGTATSGSDYVALSGTATFAAASATAVVTVTPVDDVLVEGDETVILTLDADAAYTIGVDNQATVTIADNDVAALPTVAVTATDDTATEEGTTTGAFTITRTGDVTGMLTVNYTVSGTATPNTDYLSLTGTVTFAAGAASATLLISPIDDAIVEGNETVILTLDANAAYTLGAATQATVTIVDNDEEDDNGAEDPVLVIPFDKSDCKKGGWEEFGVFKNQGDCVSFVATGGKNLPALLGDMDVEDWLDSLDS
jgi:hypothetical protein